jgi:hypothetical protein
LLVRNIEKVPVYLVVEQLKDETELLHWSVLSPPFLLLITLLILCSEGISTL